jgi:hypothetical protein
MKARRHSSALAGRPPPFPEDGGIHLIDFPVEKVVMARPRVDLAAAHFASEVAGMLVGVMLPRRRIGQSAIGTAKIFGGPDAACHGAIMRSVADVFQSGRLPPLARS